MNESEPCSHCGGTDVTIEKREMARKLMSDRIDTEDVRVCHDPACPSNKDTGKFGQGV